jgi:uncharacterized membrane protein YkvA (DUF1232 family)
MSPSAGRSLSGDPRQVVHLMRQVRLVWRLLTDRRVPLHVKAVPLLALLYLLVPIDLMPEVMIPFLGPLALADDVTIILLAVHYLIGAAPRYVVDEHRANGDVVDVTFRTRGQTGSIQRHPPE